MKPTKQISRIDVKAAIASLHTELNNILKLTRNMNDRYASIFKDSNALFYVEIYYQRKTDKIVKVSVNLNDHSGADVVNIFASDPIIHQQIENLQCVQDLRYMISELNDSEEADRLIAKLTYDI
jgi:hypothetical protein